MALSSDTGLRAPSVYHVWSSSRPENMMHFRSRQLAWWPWNWCTLLPMGWATLLPIYVFLRRFVLDLWANICQTHHNIQILTFNIGGHCACQWYGSSSVFQVWTSKDFPFIRYNTFSHSINYTGDRDLLTSTGYLSNGLPSCQFWASYAFPFESYVETYDRQPHFIFIIPPPMEVWGIIIHILATKSLFSLSMCVVLLLLHEKLKS